MAAISSAARPTGTQSGDFVSARRTKNAVKSSEVPTTPAKSGSVAKSAVQAAPPPQRRASAQIKLSEEEVKNLAAELEEAINSAQGTEVKFNVTPHGHPNALSFKVIERETGEVVREFPVEAVSRIAEKAAKQSLEGILLDEPA